MSLDTSLLLACNHALACSPLDWWGAMVNSTEIWAPLGVLAVGWVAWKGGGRGRMALLLAVLAVILGDGLVVRGLKAATARPRPPDVISGVRLVHLAHVEPRLLAFGKPLEITASSGTPSTEPRSFPSAHAWNAFSLATLACLAWRRGWIAYVPAAAVGFARVYVGIHWPSDVVAAALGGTLLTWALAAAVDGSWPRLASRLPPRVRGAFAPLALGAPLQPRAADGA